MYKVYRGISPGILNDLFPARQLDQYSFRNRLQLVIPNVKTLNTGFQSIKYHGPQIWEAKPSYLR